MNLTNGNLSLSIPLLSLPFRGEAGFALALQYDSKIWQSRFTINQTDATVSWVYEQPGAAVGAMGWHLNLPYLSPPKLVSDDQGNLTSLGEEILTMPDGSKFSIAAAQSGLDAEDGSGAHMEFTPGSPWTSGPTNITVRLANGLQIHFPTAGSVADRITDRNGNYLSIVNNVITDSAGHQITLHPHTGGQYSYYDQVFYSDSNGMQQHIDFTVQSHTFFTTTPDCHAPNFNTNNNGVACPFTYPLPANNTCNTGVCYQSIHNTQPNLNVPYPMLTSVKFPDNSTYAFEYNEYGEITKVSYPTGGYSQYGYVLMAHGETYWYDGELLNTDFREVSWQSMCPSSTGSCAAADIERTDFAPVLGGNPNQAVPQASARANSQNTVTVTKNGAILAKSVHNYVDPTAESMGYESPLETSQVNFDTDGATALTATRTQYIFYPNNFALPSKVTTYLCSGASSLSATTTLEYASMDHRVMRPIALPYWSQTPNSVSLPIAAAVSTKAEYGFVSRSDCGASDPPASSYGSLLRREVASYGLSDSNYLAARLLTLPMSSTIFDGAGSQVAATTNEYDVYAGTNHAALAVSSAANLTTAYGGTRRGNLTGVSRWVSGNSWVGSYRQYYDTGSIAADVDALGAATHYAYDSTYLAPTTITDALGHPASRSYYGSTGLLHTSTDLNSNVTTYAYDALQRPTTIQYPIGTTTIQRPSTTQIQTLIAQSSAANQETDTFLDGIGRTIESQHMDPDHHTCSGGVIHTTTSYRMLGQFASVSNPFCTPSDATYDLTLFTYDGAGRRTRTTHQGDGSYSGKSYSLNVADSFDEAGKHRQLTTDALGRLTDVYEPEGASSSPTMHTVYGYNALGDLLSVTQYGQTGDSARLRSFSYDGLSRLITATNPETGTICYGVWNGSNCINGYDANGNLANKTDARNVSVNYGYDALNRLIWKHYSDGTPPAAFGYDGFAEDGTTPVAGATNSIGRLSHSSNQINVAANYGYDAMGRQIREAVCVPSDCSYGKTVSAGYDLAGNLIDLTYPDGRKVHQTYDAAGRMAGVNYTAWNGVAKNQAYLTVAEPPGGYDAAGHVVSATFGNNVGFNASYDNRERVKTLAYGPSSTPFWSKQYGWTANSNLQSQTDLVAGVQRQFAYDNLNRLTAAQDIFWNVAGMGASGGTGSSSGSGTGTVSPPSAGGATPQWTDPDDSNVLLNPDMPGANGWGMGAEARSTITNGVAAPDGTMTASNLTANSNATDTLATDAVANPYLYSGETMTGSVWLRSPSGTRNIYLLLLQTGSAGFTAAASKLVTVTTTWQQFQLSGPTQSGLSSLYLQIGGSSSISNGATVSFWNPMVEDSGHSGATITNFLPYSQRFTGASWSPASATVTENAAQAPDGTNTAAVVTATSPTDSYITDTVANPAPYSGLPVTGSIWLRSASGPQSILLTLINFYGASGFTALGAKTVTVTSDWQRFEVGGINQTTLTELQLQVGGGLTFKSGQSIQIWGAQLELASSAGPYVATGGSAVSAGTNLTNLLPYSQQWNAASWGGTLNVLVTANAATAPDGSNTGIQGVAVSGQSDAWLINDVSHPSMYDGETITGSVFLRIPSGSRSINIYLAAENASGRTYLKTQTIQLTTDWKRFTMTGQLPTGLTRLFLQVGGANSLSSGQVVDVWGTQIEMASSAGPYVMTSALPVVAGKELVNILPSSQQTNGPGWGLANGSMVLNNAIAPDGTATATTITADPTTTDAYIGDAVPNPSLYDQQTVTGSVYLRAASGSLNINLYLTNVGENGWSAPSSKQVTVTTTWQRFSITGTNQNGLTGLFLQIGGGGSFSQSQSIQVWGAQMVIGTDPAPYTPTNSSTTQYATGTPGTLVTNGLNEAYAYDSFGNILQNNSFHATYDANNRMSGYSYDAAGNLLSNGVTNVMTWDAENRIRTVGGATYIYDAEGNRVEKQGVGVTDTIYFGGRPIA